MKISITHQWSDTKLLLVGAGGHKLAVFDFGDLKLHPDQCNILMKAFVPKFGHTALVTQRQRFRVVRCFARYLHAIGESQAPYFEREVVYRFSSWLSEKGFSSRTASSRRNVIDGVLQWGIRNIKNGFPFGLSGKSFRFEAKRSSAKQVLSVEIQKLILKACYQEIAETESRLANGRRILSGDARDQSELALRDLFVDLLQTEDGLFLPQTEWKGTNLNIHRRVSTAGGIANLCNMLWITPRSLLPFYLAILIQTSGNPDAIAKMQTTCIRAHPLRSDLERVVWEKPRARAEQMVDFPVKLAQSAPNLIRRLNALNELARRRCAAKDQNLVFICFTCRTRKVQAPCNQTLLNVFLEFLNDHELPTFNFKETRIWGARAHHKTTGSLEAARSRLNHKCGKMTGKFYSPLEVLASEHARVIRSFQGKLVSESLQSTGFISSQTGSSCASSAHPARTVFGFDCADPFAGIAQHSVKGKRCLNFTGCADCNGAIVVLDDVNSVARMIAARNALQESKEKAMHAGWILRFNALYLPTLTILERDILPAVHSEILRVAEQSAKKISLPPLE